MSGDKNMLNSWGGKKYLFFHFVCLRTEGYIVCEEHEEILRAAWVEDQELQKQKEKEVCVCVCVCVCVWERERDSFNDMHDWIFIEDESTSYHESANFQVQAKPTIKTCSTPFLHFPPEKRKEGNL